MTRALAATLVALGCSQPSGLPDAVAPQDVADASADVAVDATPTPDAPPPLTPAWVDWNPELLARPRCNAAGWCWEMPSPVGGEVSAVTSTQDDEGWYLTRDGLLVHVSSQGFEVTRVHDGDPTLARGALWAADASNVWVMLPGALLRWNGTRVQHPEFYGGFREPTLAWGRAADDLWLAGPTGDALHWDGAQWEARPVPTSADIVGLTGGASTAPWAFDRDGVVWRWRDAHWQRGERRDPLEHRALWINHDDDAWSCGDGLAFHWNGVAWTREVVDRAPASQVCVVWSDGVDAWWSDGSTVRRRNADGRWDFESETLYVTAAGGTPRNVWVGRQDGALQRIHGGEWFGVTRTRPRFTVLRIRGDDEASLRAITAATVLGFDGASWYEASAPTRFYELTGLAAIDATDAWLAGVARSGGRDVGHASRWNRDLGERDMLDTPSPLRAVAAVGDDVWAVGDGGAAWRFSQGRWTLTDTGTTRKLRDVWARAADDVWAVGDGATALRWDGARWTATTLPRALDLSRIHARAPDDAWTIGEEPATGLSQVLRWDGARWQRDTAGLPAGYRARDVWAAPDGSVWLAGSAVLHRTANVWNVSPTGVEATLEALGGTRAGVVRAGGSSSTILARR